MSDTRHSALQTTWTIALVLCWIGLAVYFMSAPLWFGLSGPWQQIWRSLLVEPPSATVIVSNVWHFARQNSWLCTTGLAIWISVNAWFVYRTARFAAPARWATRVILFALPLSGMAFITWGVYVAPRWQLAKLLDVERLPTKSDWPEAAATATNPAALLNERRDALRAMEIVCWLEKYKLASPDSSRNSNLALANTYLMICEADREPNELRLYCASQLLHNYLLGELEPYPDSAQHSREQAYQLVTEAFLASVEDGGPIAFQTPGYETFQPGDWAKKAFHNLPHYANVESRLRELTQHANPITQAEAKAALAVYARESPETTD